MSLIWHVIVNFTAYHINRQGGRWVDFNSRQQRSIRLEKNQIFILNIDNHI